MDAFNIELRSHDIVTLDDGKWLNDEIINMYGSMIMDRNNKQPDKYPRVHMFNTFFYSHLRDNGAKGYDKVKRWTKKVGISLLGFAILPLLIFSFSFLLFILSVRPLCLQVRADSSSPGNALVLRGDQFCQEADRVL